MNINHSVRGKTLIPGRLVFGGGHPKFKRLPRVVKWGNNLSLFWLGVELVFLGK